MAKVPDTALAQSAPGAVIESRQELLYQKRLLGLCVHEQALEPQPLHSPTGEAKFSEPAQLALVLPLAPPPGLA